MGQSSWGPTGFAILPSEAEVRRLIALAQQDDAVDPALRLVVCGGNNRGARVNLGPPALVRA